MDKPGNTLKSYSEFDMKTNKQKIGMFVITHNNFQSTTYVRLLSTFNNFTNQNFEACIIEANIEEEYKKVEEDLLNDNFLLDIVIIERDAFPSNEFAELLIEKCKLLGIKIIYEIDDDLMNIDKSHRDYNYFKQKSLGIYNIVKNADVVTVSTNTLKSKLNNLNDNIIIIPNVITHYWNIDSTDNIIKKDQNLIKIGYIGTTTHHHDIQLLKSAIDIINKHYKDSDKKIVFEMIGGTSEKLSWIRQIPIPLQPIDKTVFPNFTKFVKETVDWDIALAPLEDNNINSSKSELKYLEYTCLGIPGIYSDIGPYKENIINEYNGLLVKNNTPIEWAKHIIKLIDNSELRKNILKNAEIDMNINHNLDISIKMWETILNNNSRDKNTLLYDKFKYYLNSNSECPFLELLKYESYEIIKNSDLFDEEWYLSEYPDVQNAKLDPIDHYLNLGVNENCNPSRNFNTKEYMEYNTHLKLWGLNPLVHYILNDKILQRPWWRLEDEINGEDFDKNLEITAKSDEFDAKYYMASNESIVETEIDALKHWVQYGYKKDNPHCNPNNYFSKKFYSDKYLINGEEKWNPLTHYQILGKQKGYKQNIFDINYRNYSNDINDILSAISRKTTIIIPIFGPTIDVQPCIHYLFKNTPKDNDFLFIVVKKYKSKLNEILNNFQNNYNISEIDNVDDFFKYLNLKIKNIDRDVIILNSSSIVTSNWLNKLIIKAYSSTNIDMVTPLSNLTINIEKLNLEKIGCKMNYEIINKILEKSVDSENLNLKYFDGSCIFIKRESINKIDFETINITFNKNEKIFGLKTNNADITYLLDETTFIYCNPNFLENNAYLTHNHDLLLSLKIKEFSETFEIKNILNNLSNAMNNIDSKILSNRTLYIFNENEFKSIYDYLIQHEINEDVFFLTENQMNLKLWKNSKLLKKWKIEYESKKSRNMQLKDIYFNVLSSLHISKINMLDSFNLKLDLINIAKIMNIDIDIYVNNFHIFCPFITNKYYCNKECNQTFKCPHNHLKEYLLNYRRNINQIINNSTNIIVNDSIRELYEKTYNTHIT